MYDITDEFDTTKGIIKLPDSASETAQIITFFDDLFDTFNGKNGGSIIKPGSGHFRHSRKAIGMLKGCEYVQQNTHAKIKGNKAICLKNWIWTIRGTVSIWKTLKRRNFTEFNCKHLNQDPLENFFSIIRGIRNRDNNPIAYHFASAYKTALITNLTSKHCPSGNCEHSNRESSMSLKRLFAAAERAERANQNNEETEVKCFEECIPDDKYAASAISAQDVIKQMHKKIKCLQCIEQLCCNNLLNNIEIGGLL